MRTKIAVASLGAAVVLTGALSIGVAAAAELAVTVSYTGKGKVDETHEILVFLFDHPMPTADSIPLAVQSIVKNGGTATFNLTAPDTVYVVMVHDEKANYDGRSGPPPQGTPIGSYSKAGKPIAIKTAANAKVKAIFDDTRRWGQ